jgi:hypothetical protein
MWQGNPALTAVLFGLPIGFLSLICYSICCADIMDAEDEEEEEAGKTIGVVMHMCAQYKIYLLEVFFMKQTKNYSLYKSCKLSASFSTKKSYK